MEKIYHINRSVFFTDFLDQKGWRKGEPDEKGLFSMWFPYNFHDREATIQLYPKKETDVMNDKFLFYQYLRFRNKLENIPETFTSVKELSHIQDDPARLWFLKHRAGTEGLQVWVYRKKDDLMKYFTRPGIVGNYIVQREVKNPLLVFGHKMVLRVYVLIHNKKMYIYKEFFGKIHPRPYSITESREDIHIRSVYIPGKKTQVLPIRGSLWGEYERVFSRITIASQKIIREFLPVLNDEPRDQYTLLGLDYLIDIKNKPWLLEINTYPSLWDELGCASTYIKKEIIEDLYEILINPVLGIKTAPENFIRI